MNIRYLVLLLPCFLMSWSFTQKDFDNLSETQLKIIKDSYSTGKPYNLGVSLAALSVVETRAGEYKDTSDNRICGPHQVDVVVALEQSKSKGSAKKLCKEVQRHSKLSSKIALDNLRYWKNNSKGLKQAVNRYNRGWNRTEHDLEFLRRFSMVVKVLEKNQSKLK